ncbi:hypothetical protein [Streptomyces rubellomurinus]|nr:hypothetical protein [Streptomyces rubellomurinus]
MRVHEDLVLRARVRLLSHNDRILYGEEGLQVYRVLFAANPRVYAYKLAVVLRMASESHRVAGLPEARQALVAEARAVSAHIPADAPAYQRRLWDSTVAELVLRDGRPDSGTR